jgi:hypothetical protein
MRTLASLSMAMLFAGALFGQNHSGGRSGRSNGGFHRGGGFRPGGSGYASPGLVGSGIVGSGLAGYGAAPVMTYVYPVYVGSGYTDGTYAPPPDAPQSVMDAYVPQPAPAAADQSNPEPVSRDDESSTAQTADRSTPDHYLIALKDHTIYSVVAYWVNGDTLHYFTAGNVHNQASLSLVDRDLTMRLNNESGHEVTLPPAK